MSQLRATCHVMIAHYVPLCMHADDMQLVESGTHEPQADAAYELAVAGSRDGSQGGKLIGHRDFARFYRQRHRPSDTRASVAANAVVSRHAHDFGHCSTEPSSLMPCSTVCSCRLSWIA